MIDTCVKCKKIAEVELHHSAPRAIFREVLGEEEGEREAEAYPKFLLCVPCHRKWHTVLLRYFINYVEGRAKATSLPLAEARAVGDALDPLSNIRELEDVC